MMKDNPTFVTRPDLPPLEEFLPTLQAIWDSRVLTNGGPFHKRFESELADFLGVRHVSLFANATIALITALQALRIRGEVITTPYSFVATAHSLLWNGITPVFVDIDPETLNLDPDKIEQAITPRTTAIMPVHCYGRPCDVQRIQDIADNYNLKVIYDAAHAFGVRHRFDGTCTSALAHGDLSVLSFHATKVFNTFEGGAIVSHDARSKQHIDHLKNFGFANETTVVAAGINGKMNEFSAALGLHQLRRFTAVVEARKNVEMHYRSRLQDVPGIRLLEEDPTILSNHSYMPIFIEPGYGVSRDALYRLLRDKDVMVRRYFHPLITDFPMYRHLPSADSRLLPHAQRAASQVLCLPIYPDLPADVVDMVCDVIATNQRRCLPPLTAELVATGSTLTASPALANAAIA